MLGSHLVVLLIVWDAVTEADRGANYIGQSKKNKALQELFVDFSFGALAAYDVNGFLRFNGNVVALLVIVVMDERRRSILVGHEVRGMPMCGTKVL